jgi:hypothetical protein
MTDEYLGREMYYFIPRNDLKVSACAPEDYVAGPLEDWIEGALRFDGSRVATLTHAEMTRSMRYPGPRGAAIEYDGSKRESLDMNKNNFLIEVVFKTDAGRQKGVLASKMDQSGYELAIDALGGVRMTLAAGGSKASVSSQQKVNDGKWHHLLAEVDRSAGKSIIYIDGKPAGEGNLTGIAPDAALSNTADFIVGKGFSGAMDFLRVCRSTLAESKTSIDELYTWEFNGPFLSDFTGNTPAPGKSRDAGAIQAGE